MIFLQNNSSCSDNNNMGGHAAVKRGGTGVNWTIRSATARSRAVFPCGMGRVKRGDKLIVLEP